MTVQLIVKRHYCVTFPLELSPVCVVETLSVLRVLFCREL